jgi:hypothetical protein
MLCKVEMFSFHIVVFCIFSEEDRYNSYSQMVLKYFMAEGVLCGHELFLASAQDHPDDILTVSKTQQQSVQMRPLPVLLCLMFHFNGQFTISKSVQPKR